METDGRLGFVHAVRGGTILCRAEGSDVRVPQVGEVVGIPAGGRMLLGRVQELRRGRRDDPPLYEAQLFGMLEDGPPRFCRGVPDAPPLDAPVVRLPASLERVIYALGDRPAVVLGTTRGGNVEVTLAVDALLGRHFAVVGSSGSGKSTVLGRVLDALVRGWPHAHVLLVDAHGEYAPVFGENARRLDAGSLPLPHWLLGFDELAHLVCGPESHAERLALHDALLDARRAAAGRTLSRTAVTVDTPLPYPFSALSGWLEQARGSLERRHDPVVLGRLIQRLAAVRDNPRYGFLFADLAAGDSLAAVLSTLFALHPERPRVVLLDTSTMAAEVADVVVAVLARLAFEFGLWSGPDERRPLLFACEEAHRYCPADPARGDGPARRAIERLAREGRKYGIGLALVSQRPADLSPVAFSQCGTVIALRTGSDEDRRHVERALPDGWQRLLDRLPALATGEALVAGEAVAVPTVVQVKPLPPERTPRSRTPSFAAAWSTPCEGPAHVARVVARWRRGCG